MTNEFLTKCNLVKARINEINSLLKQIEPVNTATGEPRTAPICVQAGINSPVEFYVGGDFMENPLSDIDNAIYDQLVNLLKSYKQSAERIFAEMEE